MQPLQEGDFAFLQKLWLGIYGQDFACAKVFDLLCKKQLEGSAICWLMILNESHNEIIGTCELNNLALEHRASDLGCELATAYRGYGYMQEALQCLLQHACEQMQITSFAANIREENEKSRQLFTRLGFVYSGQNVEIGNIVLQRFLLQKKD